MWSDLDDAIIGGDLTAALAYATPAGGAVPTPVAPIGLRDREAGTVSFTTSLGFGRKLDRIKENPRVALAYHAREHGFARDPRFVLVQGMASYDSRPDPAVLEERVRPASTRFMGAPKAGVFWDRWLSAYYADRVLVTVQVERVLSWPDLACAGERTVVGTPPTDEDPPSQAPPAKGSGPRVDVARAARRAGRPPHVLVAYLGADGFPRIVPVSVGAAGASGIALAGPLPGGRSSRRPARPPLRGAVDRPRDASVHRLARGLRVRTAHRERLPRAGQQDRAAAGQRVHGAPRPQAGARARPRLTCGPLRSPAVPAPHAVRAACGPAPHALRGGLLGSRWAPARSPRAADRPRPGRRSRGTFL